MEEHKDDPAHRRPHPAHQAAPEGEREPTFSLEGGNLIIHGPFADERPSPFARFGIGPKGVAKIRELLLAAPPPSSGSDL
jgi:hypothetical protein